MKPKFICSVCGDELESEIHTVRVFEPKPTMIVVVNIHPCKSTRHNAQLDLVCAHTNTEAINGTIVCKDCGSWL